MNNYQCPHTQSVQSILPQWQHCTTSLIPPANATHITHMGFLYTVNGETFTGLNFRDIHSTWIFTVIHSRYKARDQYMFILRAKIHRKNVHASLKDRESLAQ